MAKAHCITTFFDSATGVALTSATVNVYNPGTVTPISATLFDKSNNPLSNPLTSDATTGIIDFYLTVAQTVDLVVSKSGFSTRTYSNVMVLDDASFDNSAVLTTTGDMLYASANNTPARLAVSGTTGAVLNVASGAPAWSTVLQLSTTVNSAAIGAAAVSYAGLVVQPTNLTANVGQQYMVIANGTFTSAATSAALVFNAQIGTAAASFTIANAYNYLASPPSLGASSAITNCFGFRANNQGASGVTNAYGVYIDGQSGAATQNFALAALSECLLGTQAIANNATVGFVDICSNAGTPTGVPAQVPSGYQAMRYDTTNHKLWVYDSGWKGVVLS